MTYRVLSLFAGIGGFDLGLERTGGFKTVAFCEIEPFPQSILRKHWPEVPIYDDVRTLTGERLVADGIAVDVIVGGFPCQDLSVAGRLAGIEDGTRSGLWSEVIRLVGEIRPRYLIVENVSNLLRGPSDRRGRWFGRVLGDLAERGYDAEWENIPASALGAPHRRERVWLVSYPAEERSGEVGAYTGPRLGWQVANDAGPLCSPLADAQCRNEKAQHQTGVLGEPSGQGAPARLADGYLSADRQWLAEPGMGRVVDGVSNRAHRIAALGNAVVPQIPELIGRAILAAEAA